MKTRLVSLFLLIVAASAGCRPQPDEESLLEKRLSGEPLQEYRAAVAQANSLSGKQMWTKSLEASQNRGGETEASVSLASWPMFTMTLGSPNQILADCRRVAPGMYPVPRVTKKGDVLFELVPDSVAARTPYRVTPSWETTAGQ